MSAQFRAFFFFFVFTDREKFTYGASIRMKGGELFYLEGKGGVVDRVLSEFPAVS